MDVETKFDFPHVGHARLRIAARHPFLIKDAVNGARFEALTGCTIDEKLMAKDVRLTMGGEPTFVSVTNRDGLEWNFTALSPEKQQKGEMLLKRLRDRYATGALLHYGQGKVVSRRSAAALGV